MLPADVGAGSFTVKFIGLAGFALGSNMIAICSNTTVYVGVTIFALCWSALRLPGSCQPLESESLIEVASGTFLYCALLDLLLPALLFE